MKWTNLRALLPALLLLAAAACWAAQDTPVVVYGLVKGTVMYDGAGPLRNVTVTVVATAGAPLTLTTDKDGIFTGMVPVGRATALVEGSTITFEVAAGQVNNVNLTIVPDKGILIQALNPDKTPYINAFLTGALREANGAPRFLNARVLGNGRYWFPDVPGSATEFAVSVSVSGSYISATFLKRWSFQEFAALRKLGVVVPKAVPVAIPIVNTDGVRLAGLPLQGRLAGISPDPFSAWSDTPREPSWRDADLKAIVKPTLATDDQGNLDLGKLAPQTYALSVSSADADGDFVQFEVKSDGTVTLKTYTLHPARQQVSQTVFTPEGKPAVNAEVYASYCRAGKVTINKGTSDAHGIVVWPSLPCSPVIVSGAQVAACVLPATGTSFTTPLPAPVAERERKFHLNPGVTGQTPASYGTLFAGSGHTYMNGSFVRMNKTMTGQTANEIWPMAPGAPFRFAWAASFTPMSMRLLDAYLPYVPEGMQQVEMPVDELPCAELTGVEVHCTVTRKDAAPLPLGSTVVITPAKTNRAAEMMAQPRFNWLLRATTAPDGSFRISLPPTGEYTLALRVNGKDGPAQTLTLQPGGPKTHEVALMMPAEIPAK